MKSLLLLFSATSGEWLGLPFIPAGATDMATIYHNPKCGTSRKVLGLLRQSGTEPRIVEYLKTPPTRAELTDLLTRMGMTPRQLLRRKEAAFAQLGLADTAKSDAELIDAMMENPILMERPIVVTDKGVRLCRPAETVEELLG
jgi:arsenate reductase